MTLATGNPGRAYEMLYDYVSEHGGTFLSATDQEAFNAIRTLAALDGMSVEPATGVTFAGLILMVKRGIIKPNDVVVINCSGHTLPVETHILGEHWQYLVDLEEHSKSTTAVVPTDSLLNAVKKVGATPTNAEGKRKIVVIEDNHDAARLMLRILESQERHEILLAHDGAEGLRLIREHKPDLVVTDLMMPEVDGFAVIEQVKSDPELSTIPIVVVSAKELSVSEREYLSGQIDMILQKGSFIDEQFVDQLVKALR